AAKVLILAYNHAAVTWMTARRLREACKVLSKAMLLTHARCPYLGGGSLRPHLRALTLNNLGCVMKIWKRPRVGLRYLKAALSIEKRHPPADGTSGTHLNCASAMSALGMHADAAWHAHAAVEILQQAKLQRQQQEQQERRAAANDGS
ncbi:unnamed protein product, partial [Phaeothamnion confervicola]